ncbi:MAG: type III secretion system chaperone [Puniceicoccales bacterium]|jgi:hypothetical protein|nr:type III secretion system chaperone [Puniceicoccales bacterium]
MYGMDLRAYVDELLQAIGKSLDLPGLALDTNGHCVLLFDDKVVLNIELDEEKELLIIYSYIGEIPFEGRETIFETLLESNLFWKNTQGATIGIDKQTQTVVLAFPMELPLKRKENFEERLALFVDITESWIARLEEMSTQAELIANEDQQ